MSGPRVAWALACLASCAPVSTPQCEALNAALVACLGEQVEPVACDSLSRADTKNLTLLLEDLDCEGRGSALPIDGDPASAACRLAGLGCVAPVNPLPEYRPTRYPVVLVNGIDTSPLFQYAPRILEVMRKVGGHDVHLAIDTPYETPQVRAGVLWARIQEVLAQTQADRVNLICHSLGGLECRYLVSPGGLGADLGVPWRVLAAKVASVTTVATAHRGTRAVDVALGYEPGEDAGQAADRLATSLAGAFTPQELDQDLRLRAAVGALSTPAAAAFNAHVTDADGVYYQSYAGFSAPYGRPPIGQSGLLETLCRTSDGREGRLHFLGRHDHLATPLIPTADLVAQDPGLAEDEVMPNDGLVAVASARWGHFRGCIPADHMEQLGQYHLPNTNVRTGFDVARFYANVAGDLAERGL